MKIKGSFVIWYDISYWSSRITLSELTLIQKEEEENNFAGISSCQMLIWLWTWLFLGNHPLVVLKYFRVRHRGGGGNCYGVFLQQITVIIRHSLSPAGHTVVMGGLPTPLTRWSRTH